MDRGSGLEIEYPVVTVIKMYVIVFLDRTNICGGLSGRGDSSDDEQDDSSHAHIPFADAFAAVKPLRDAPLFP